MCTEIDRYILLVARALMETFYVPILIRALLCFDILPFTMLLALLVVYRVQELAHVKI